MGEDTAREELTVVPEEIPKELRDFVNERGRPAVFVLLPAELLEIGHAVRLRGCLRDKYFPELDVVVHTGGGDIHAAYLIVALLHLHAKKLTACVPLIAKSAGTLICIGMNKIVLDEVAQLGPLDTQVNERSGSGAQPDAGGFSSALNPFKALEHLEKISLKSFTRTTQTLSHDTGMSLRESFEHALSFVGTTTAPLFKQLEPQKFGIYRRALAVGEEYGTRILKRFHGWDEEVARETIRRIIHEYPSHDYIIDLYELKEMGFKAELFPKEQRDVIDGLFPCLGSKKSIVTCVEPTVPTEAVQAGRNGQTE
jgi:hypothetical protein